MYLITNNLNNVSGGTNDYIASGDYDEGHIEAHKVGSGSSTNTHNVFSTH